MSILKLSLDAPEKVSQSLLARLDVCLASGALYLKHRRDSVTTAALVRGELCHEFAEQATHMLMEQGENSLPGEVGKDLMQSLIEERADFALPVAEQDACRVFAWNWSEGTVIDPESVVCVEGMLELAVNGWVVRGRIDRAAISGGEGWVHDLKSSLHVPSQEVFEKRWQTPFYGLLLAEGVPEGDTVPLGRGLNGVHVLEEYPRWRGDDGIFARHAYLDRGQLHDVKRAVESHLTKLERCLATGEWPATPGTWCGTCPAAGECPIEPHLRGVKTIGTADDALEVAEHIGRAEQGLRGDKAALKAWVDEHGDVVVGDEAWTFTFTETERMVDKQTVKDFIEEHGGDVSDFFRPAPSTRFGKKKVAS